MNIDKQLLQMSATEGPAHKALQQEFFETAAKLLTTKSGLAELSAHADQFDKARVFEGGPWEKPTDLQVALVPGTLRASGLTPVVESLSELRMLAIATGRVSDAPISASDAGQFLNEVIARNLRYLFPTDGETEEEREGVDEYRESNQRLLSLIVRECGIKEVLGEVLIEVEMILAQRPISTVSVRRMIAQALQLANDESLKGAEVDRLQHLHHAAQTPTPISKHKSKPSEYRAAIAKTKADALCKEAEIMAKSMLETGLVAPLHAELVRYLLANQPELLPIALGTDEAGTIEVQNNQDLLFQIIDTSVFATTAQCIYGLSLALNRTLLSRVEVAAGLERLMGLEIREDVATNLLAHRSEDDNVTAAGALLAGAIAVLGQPLGVGQGRNPTCQSARGISLWAQHDPAHLLKLVVSAVRDGRVQMLFHGHMVRSDELPMGVASVLDLDLDPVSIVLVPHLDRLYSEFMRRSVLQLEDAHKWVNPALYGRWVQYELKSAFSDVYQTSILNFDDFVRCFFATHHPEYNGGHRLMYPNPVGLVITNSQGSYLGPHAVSIQRIDTDDAGEFRVYFFNPNNEGRQNWGYDVVATVQGHGELPGESSLPFESFAARLYAFHYNPNEQGELAAVPQERIDNVSNAARQTWGKRFHWLDPVH